jgi:hypothetical protein
VRAALIVIVFLAGVGAGVLAYRWQDPPRTPVPAIDLRRPAAATTTQAPTREGGPGSGTAGAATEGPAPVPAGRPASRTQPQPQLQPPAVDRDDDEDDDDDLDDFDDADDGDADTDD